jgi:hypothetical protein
VGRNQPLYNITGAEPITYSTTGANPSLSLTTEEESITILYITTGEGIHHCPSLLGRNPSHSPSFLGETTNYCASLLGEESITLPYFWERNPLLALTTRNILLLCTNSPSLLGEESIVVPH